MRAARAGCEMLFPCAVFMLIILIRMLVKVDDVAFSAWRRAQLCAHVFWLARVGRDRRPVRSGLPQQDALARR